MAFWCTLHLRWIAGATSCPSCDEEAQLVLNSPPPPQPPSDRSRVARAVTSDAVAVSPVVRVQLLPTCVQLLPSSLHPSPELLNLILKRMIRNRVVDLAAEIVPHFVWSDVTLRLLSPLVNRAARYAREAMLRASTEDPDALEQAVRAIDRGIEREIVRYLEALRALMEIQANHATQARALRVLRALIASLPEREARDSLVRSQSLNATLRLVGIEYGYGNCGAIDADDALRDYLSQLSLWRDLERYAAQSELIGSSSLSDRNRAISSIRGADKIYTPGQGWIMLAHLLEAAAAIAALAHDLADAPTIFCLERGGALMAEELAILLRRSDLRICSIAKRPNAEATVTIKDEHIGRLKLAIVRHVASCSGNGPVDIAVTETVVGGGSATKILEVVTDVLQSCPRLRVRVLLLRQTLHLRSPVPLSGQLDLEHAGDRLFLCRESRSSSITIPAALPGLASRCSVFIRSTSYIPGEDVSFQCSRVGSAPNAPIVIFDPLAGRVAAIAFRPSCGLTPRLTLGALLAQAMLSADALVSLLREQPEMERPTQPRRPERVVAVSASDDEVIPIDIFNSADD